MSSLSDSFINFVVVLKQARSSEMKANQQAFVYSMERSIQEQIQTTRILLQDFIHCTKDSSND
ncbi:hypothetical protein RHO13_01870 [Orbus wheelerorum]|uniref:hypothetical protein n=1 Tax=Orbus wheelerorum TaxID=3074111 RepID=UPI00370D9C2B